MRKEHAEKFFRTVYFPKHEVLFEFKKNFETIYTKKNKVAWAEHHMKRADNKCYNVTTKIITAPTMPLSPTDTFLSVPDS